MRWHYRDPLLVWLFPASYGVHILEEWFGGFPAWLAHFAGRPLPSSAFIAINAVALALMTLATREAARRDESGWLAVGIATITLVNGILHIVASLVTGTYSPGLFTSVVLYLPLSQLALLRAWHQAPPRLFARGVVAGIAVHAVVSVLALTLASAA